MFLARSGVLALCCLFAFPAVSYMGGVCLSPLERMALFSGSGGSGKKSYKSRIRKINRNIRTADRRIEQAKEDLDKATDELANSLDSGKLKEDASDAAEKIANYMAGEQDGWDCRPPDDDSGSSFLRSPEEGWPLSLFRFVGRTGLFRSAVRGLASFPFSIRWSDWALPFRRSGFGLFPFFDSLVGLSSSALMDKFGSDPTDRLSSLVLAGGLDSSDLTGRLGSSDLFDGFGSLDLTDRLSSSDSMDMSGSLVSAGGLGSSDLTSYLGSSDLFDGFGSLDLTDRLSSSDSMDISGSLVSADGLGSSDLTDMPGSSVPPDRLVSSPFFSVVFGPALPLMLTSAPAFATLRVATVAFSEDNQPDNKNQCTSAGGSWAGTSSRDVVCQMQSVWNRCKNHYPDYIGITNTGECVCKQGNQYVFCEDQLKKEQRKTKCEQLFPQMTVQKGVRGGRAGELICYCLYRGTEILCKELQLCYSKYKDKFTHLDGVTCMCGDDPCSVHHLGGKLQKCIDKNKDIYSGVTVKPDGTCMCGGQSCDDLRKKIQVCQRQHGRQVARDIKITVKNEECYCGDELCSSLLTPVSTQLGGTSVPSSPPVAAVEESLSLDVESADSRPDCKPWQKRDWFKRNGKVRDKSFCGKFASDVKDCRDAFEDIRAALKKLENRKKRKDDLEDSLRETKNERDEARYADDDGEDETEASGLCLKCLQDVRKATGPSAWQRFGDGLSIALGVGLSTFGLSEARRAQRSTNELLALQGFPAENNFGYNMAGLSVGAPFVAKGIYGMTHSDNTHCNHTASPYGHAYPSYPVF